MIVAVVVAACSSGPLDPPSPSPAEPTSSASPSVVATLATAPPPSTTAEPSPGPDPARGLHIPEPYVLAEPTGQQLAELSGNIRGLPEDVAEAAGGGLVPADFPIGIRFISDGPRSVGAVALVPMSAEVAALPGLLETIARPVAAESNARLSFETVDGIEVAVLQGPIASALAIVHGHVVMAQSGQPAVRPIDLMAAIIEANPDGFDGGAS